MKEKKTAKNLQKVRKEKGKFRFLFKIPPSKKPSNLNKIQCIDTCLSNVNFKSLTGSNYIELNNLNILSDIYTDNVLSLHSLTSSYTLWNLYSEFTFNVCKSKSVMCYTSFRKKCVEGDALITSELLFQKFYYHLKYISKKQRIHRQPLKDTCDWLALHLHRMIKKNGLGLLLSRSKGFHVSTSREAKLNGVDGITPSFKYLIPLIDFLIDEKSLCQFKGYNYEDYEESQLTLILPIGDLLDHLIMGGVYEDDDDLVFNDCKVVIRDNNKKPMNYKHFPERKEFIEMTNKELGKLKDLINKTSITLDGCSLDLNGFSRIYSRESLSCGGRLFDNGQWTTLPKDLRSKVMICNENIITIDLKALHPSLLFREKGIELKEGYDPYPELNIELNIKDIKKFQKYYGIDNYNVKRNIAKISLLIMINSGSKREAIQAIRYKVLKDLSKAGTVREKSISYIGFDLKDIEKVVNQIEIHNTDIKEYFYTEASLRLMRVDSDIMMGTISKLLSKDILGLPLHDSISVAESHKEIAIQALKDSYEEVLGDLVNFRYEFE